MSDITVGSVWLERNESNESNEIYTVKNIALNPDDGLVYVLLDKMFEGWDIFSKNDFLRKFKPKLDMVNEPPHYKDASGIECIEVTKHMSFCGGSCFKYIYRCGKKYDDIEDLKKAVKYTEWSCEIREKVSRYPSELIEKISMHREGHIKKAMEYVSQGCWALAGNAIKAEIARLESEAADE